MKTFVYGLLYFAFPFLINGQTSSEFFTMFYNVENLFDTINDPLNDDEEFLPVSNKQWNTKRYSHKLNQLERVFTSINTGYLPNIIGLCEVENINIKNDLLKQPFFHNHTYTIIHQNSPDLRGIDCAVLFDDKFELISHEFIEINIPGDERPTRDIVYVKLAFERQVINIFINHWPSRWGGQKETNYKRTYYNKKGYIKKFNFSNILV